MLTIGFVLCALQALAIATPLRQEQGGTEIALSKRQQITDISGDVVNVGGLLAQVEAVLR